MYLKHLTINGFKSFAKKGELEFSAPITAIVGPNGSGKSNVAESFRFVLGEQSLKSLRGKKGEDMIFNGSHTTSRGNRATVTILLDNQKRVFPMDFDEIEVERSVNRDGVNEYAINGSKVRLKDVQELLSAANIGPTGHHIISQGEADRILSASGRERREMIEDALGLKMYQYKKVEAEKKLKKTAENIERVQSLRREVAPHLKFLEKQVKKIERSIELRNELTTFYSEYLKREDTYLAHHTDRLTALRRPLVSQLEDLREKLAEAKEVLAKQTHDAKRDELLALESTLTRTRAERQQLLRQSGQYEGQVSYLERRIADMKAKAAAGHEAPIPAADVKNLLATIERDVEDAVVQDDVTQLRRALSNVVHAIRTFIEKVGGAEAIDTREEEQEIATAKAALQKTARAIEEKATEETNYTAAYNDLKHSIEAESQENREAEREVFRIVGEQRDCENELARIDGELRVLERDRDEFKRELQEAVSLIGRGAASYFTFAIVLDGVEILPAAIIDEPRDKQRDRRRELEKMKIRLEELGGVNDDIEKEYKEVKERDEFLEREITDLEASVVKLQELIRELSVQLNERFVAGIDKIGAEFNRFFALMFGGGEAKLVRVKPKIKTTKKDINEFGEEIDVDDEADDEEAEEGVELDVKLPNKRVRGLEMLSGGERALTSIALIFAMSQVNPPLFIILDETDAALDEANSRRYGDMITALAERSQLILITHNRETMSRAGILYGVTMGGDGISKLLSVKFEEAVAVAK